MSLLVGTSGWYYKDWEPAVYPKGLPASERLSYFARRMPTVEVNTTFYRTPRPDMVKGWIAKTKDVPRFEFTLKAPKDLTQEALAKASPHECARLAREWADAVPRILAEADRLGAVLLQLSPGVLHGRDALERLERTLETLREFRLAVELRNKTWLQPPENSWLRPDARRLLDAHHATLVAVDGPSWPNMLFEDDAPHAYVRFHGRNADVWNRGRTVEHNPDDPRMNRYDYKYEPKELEPWAKTVRKLADEREVRVYFNNHPFGQAYHDAKLFERMVTATAGAEEPPARRGGQTRLPWG